MSGQASSLWTFFSSVAQLYNPQRAEGRLTYLSSMLIAGGLFLLLYGGGLALADWEEGVSDETLMWIAQYPFPFLTNLILFFTIAATIRRLHDMGFPGAPALRLCIPEPWFILVPLALLWPSAKAPFAGTRREANFGVITHGIVR